MWVDGLQSVQVAVAAGRAATKHTKGEDGLKRLSKSQKNVQAESATAFEWESLIALVLRGRRSLLVDTLLPDLGDVRVVRLVAVHTALATEHHAQAAHRPSLLVIVVVRVGTRAAGLFIRAAPNK